LRIAIDSNRYTDLRRGLVGVEEVVANASEVYVPLIVLGELRAGFAFGTKRHENESILARFLQLKGVCIAHPDEQTTFFYADLYAFLRAKGRPIPTNDLWIAALVIQHNLTLFDRDSDFDNLPQIPRVRLP
jgi:predicted nucleic acid-binding protein